MTQALENLDFREVDRARWDDLDRLFEARGGPKYCWCMLWRRMPSGESRSDSQAKKNALHEIVDSGTPVGILGYLDDEPVAWCSIAPRDSYRKPGRTRRSGGRERKRLVDSLLLRASQAQR